MRGYCLLSTKKDVTYFGEGSDAYETLFKGIQYRMNTTELIQSGLLGFFSPEEAKQIIKASELPVGNVTRLDGRSMWVPISRLKYLPLLTLALGAFLLLSIPMAAKSVSVFGFEMPADKPIFPLLFILTDMINELFGYQITKRYIRYLALILVIAAMLVQLSLFLEPGDTISATLLSDTSSDEIIRGFDAIYTDLPPTLIVCAGSLLVGDTFNAYLFAQLKEFMYGKKLWLRSLCSSCFACVSFTLTFFIIYQLCRWEWPGPESMSISHVITCIITNLPHFILALPIFYYVRNCIYKQEKKMLANMGNAELLEDKEIRDAERQEYWN